MKLSNFIANYPQFEGAAKSLIKEYCESYQLKDYMQAFRKRRNANEAFERDTHQEYPWRSVQGFHLVYRVRLQGSHGICPRGREAGRCQDHLCELR